MMMNIRKQRLAVAVAGTLGLMASTAQAVEFTASTTLQNTLAVTAITPLDIGTIFAASTGRAITDGLAAMTIAADGTIDYDLSDADLSMRSLGGAVPAQGSVESAANFILQLPDTSGYDSGDWSDGVGADLEGEFITSIGGDGLGLEATELRISADESIPALYLVHFTAGDVSGGAATLPAIPVAANDGIYEVDMDFGESTYVFNIGATVVTQPGLESGAGLLDGDLAYEEGTYSGTFEVTASY